MTKMYGGLFGRGEYGERYEHFVHLFLRTGQEHGKSDGRPHQGRPLSAYYVAVALPVCFTVMDIALSTNHPL